VKQVVYDTHTFVRGLIDPREPYINLFRLPAEWRLCVSDVILREALEVLVSPAGLVGRFFGLSEISLAEAYRRVSRGEVYPVPADIEIEICEDPQDNKFLASALAMDCEYLVSQIPELLELERNREWLAFKQTNSVRVEVVDVQTFMGILSGLPQ